MTLAIHFCTPLIILDSKKMKFWIVAPGIDDFLIYYGLLEFLNLPSLFSLHQYWKIGISSGICCCCCFVFGTTHFRKMKLSHDRENIIQNTTWSKKDYASSAYNFFMDFYECCLLLFFMSKYLLNRWFLWKNGSIWKALTLFRNISKEVSCLQSIHIKWEWTHWRKYQRGAGFSQVWGTELFLSHAHFSPGGQEPSRSVHVQA